MVDKKQLEIEKSICQQIAEGLSEKESSQVKAFKSALKAADDEQTIAALKAAIERHSVSDMDTDDAIEQLRNAQLLKEVLVQGARRVAYNNAQRVKKMEKENKENTDHGESAV